MIPHDSSNNPPINEGLLKLINTPDSPIDLPLIDVINEKNLTEEEKLVKVQELINSKVNCKTQAYFSEILSIYTVCILIYAFRKALL